jgi:hypothetical protein
MNDARYKRLGGGQYPSKYDEDAPVSPALPVPVCRCEPGNQLAVVQQSRHPKTTGRAFYICKWNYLGNPCHCFFFQWIDGPDKFDPRIWLFLTIAPSLGRTMSLDDRCLPHQIQHLWQRRRSKKMLYIVWTILLNVIAVFVPNFRGPTLVSLQSSLPFLDAR